MMRSPWLRAALALGIVSLSLLVSAIVFPDDRVLFSVLLLGVLVSAWYGGLLIGLTATVLAVVGRVAVPWGILGRGGAPGRPPPPRAPGRGWWRGSAASLYPGRFSAARSCPRSSPFPACSSSRSSALSSAPSRVAAGGPRPQFW